MEFENKKESLISYIFPPQPSLSEEEKEKVRAMLAEFGGQSETAQEPLSSVEKALEMMSAPSQERALVCSGGKCVDIAAVERLCYDPARQELRVTDASGKYVMEGVSPERYESIFNARTDIVHLTALLMGGAEIGTGIETPDADR